MNDRIQKFILKEGIAPTRFAELIGVQRSSISHIISGRNKPSYDMITSILNTFPKLNPDWLLLGKGEMYRRVIQTSIFDQPNNQNQIANTSKIDNVNKESSEVEKSKGSENPLFDSDVERVVIFYKNRTFKEYYPK